MRKNRNARFGLIRDQVELRILREENAKLRAAAKGTASGIGRGFGFVASALNHGASGVASAARSMTGRVGDALHDVRPIRTKNPHFPPNHPSSHNHCLFTMSP